MNTNKPIRIFKCGAIRAAVWRNTITRNGKEIVTHSVQIDRTFKDGEQFKKTNIFFLQDLHKVEIVARRALEFLSLEVRENGQEGEIIVTCPR